MKLKIRVKCSEGICFPTDLDKGDWIDLHASRSVRLKKGEMCIIPLGVAMKLPEGFEAHILPRSSTPKKFNILCANSQGIIDHSYCGDKDMWGFPALAIDEASVTKGDRICQFRIELSQKATVLQKLKWLLCSGVHLEPVPFLKGNNRGGFGSTGK